MSLFRTASAPVQVPSYTGLQVQTASSALPIPICYGTNRLAPNLIWNGAFRAIPQYSKSSGGKGGGHSSVSGYTYATSAVFAIGEGPVSGLGAVWRGGGTYAASDFFLGLFAGTTPQAPWGYLQASFPQAALGYQGTAYAATSAFDLGSDASIGTLAFEVVGRLAASAVVNGHDADPALIVADLLTSPQYGVGFPAASLQATTGTSGDASYQSWCRAAGLALSPCLADSETASAILARWLTLTGATALWSGGRLKILPFADAPVTGALADGTSATFVPATTPVMDLTDDDFVHDADADPVLVTRSDPYAAPNVQRLEMLDRGNAYSPTPVEARDQNAIDAYGPRPGSTLTAHEICDLAVAATSAQLILARALYVRKTYAFRLSWDCGLLEPMDLVTLTDANLGLTRTPVRLTAISEGSDGLLDVTAEEYPGTVATVAAAYPVAGAAGAPLDRNVAPAAVNPPVIFEPPPELTGDAAQVWIGVSGGSKGVADPNWGGATIYVSADNATYTAVGTVNAAAHQGVLTAALPAAATSASVGLAMSGGALALAGGGPQLTVWIDGEIVGAATATLTGAATYALGGLARRLYGQRGGAHAAGAPVLALDSAVFRYAVPTASIGQPLWLKFASFNLFGGAAQDLSTCTAYPFTPIGSGLFGPVAQAIAVGTSSDDGLASGGVNEADSFGLASDPYTELVDMGLASDGTQALGLGAGGTGAVTPATARMNLGAAASGANADITSLTGLTGLAVGTALDPNNPLVVKAATALFDNTGGSVAITIDKATAGASAAHLFQTGYSGRAQAGLLGSDRYRISVSAAGTSFTQALDLDPATGHVGLAGYTADGNNALGVTGTACLFTAATDSMRFTFNKVAAANDATLSFQTGFSARALLGTTGSDQFQLKVSPDGSTFFQVFVADQTTGNAAFKALLGLAPYAVAGLPAAAFNGALAFASNGRKAGEASGSGTGVVVAYSNGAWRRLSDDTVVAS